MGFPFIASILQTDCVYYHSLNKTILYHNLWDSCAILIIVEFE